MLIVSIPMFLVAFFIVKPVFIAVFGNQWGIAGDYAQLLLPSIAFQFIVNPLSFLLYIAGKQRENLAFNLFLFIGISGVFYITNSHESSVLWLSIVTSIFYLTQFIYITRLTIK